MSAPLSISLIDWWLGKTPQERTAFLEAENTSDNVREKLAAIEAHCLANPYQVFRDSSLRPRPFAPRLLSSGTRKPEGEASEAFSQLPLFCGAPAVQIGARFLSSPKERAAVRHAAANHIEEVTQRVAAFLHSEGAVAGGGGEQVAGMMVRVLVEAMSAGLHRTGAAAAIDARETEQHAKAEQRKSAALFLKLHLGRSGNTREAGVAKREGAKQSSPTAATAVVRTKPVAVCTNEAVGFLGLARCYLAPAVPADRKRPREEEESQGVRNPWAALRSAMAKVLPPVEVDQTEAATNSTTTPDGPAPLASVEVTRKDMALALLKVARLPEYTSLFTHLSS